MEKEQIDITPKGMLDFLSGREKTNLTPEEIKQGAKEYDQKMGDLEELALTAKRK